ncbi:MAG: hypothetical protein LC772_01855, partial [Chloroflexi bacterium]|nr:hypothetical protein [Chloroflexota bacterium]
MRRLFCTMVLLCAGVIAGIPAQAASVATNDGLSLQFRDADAAITSVREGGQDLKLNGSPGGFYVADLVGDNLLGKMDYRSSAFPGTRLQATARSSPTGVVVQGQVNDLWVRARIESRGDYLSITGDLVNLRPDDDRAAILYFRLPIDATGDRWAQNLGVDQAIQAGTRYI